MTSTNKFAVPRGFLDLVKKRQATLGLSLREISVRAGISVSFLSRILLGDRGLPSDDIILRIAAALDIKPPEKLLIEAGRAPQRTLPLLRASSELSPEDFNKVLKLAAELVERPAARRRRRK